LHYPKNIWGCTLPKKRHDYSTLAWSNILRRIWFFRQEDESESGFWDRVGIDKHKRSKWYNHVNPQPSIEAVNEIVSGLRLNRQNEQDKILWLTYGDRPFVPSSTTPDVWRALTSDEFVEEFVLTSASVYEKRKHLSEDAVLAIIAEGYRIARERTALAWPASECGADPDSDIFFGDWHTSLDTMIRAMQRLGGDFQFFEHIEVLTWLQESLCKIQDMGEEPFQPFLNYQEILKTSVWDRIGKKVTTAVRQGITAMMDCDSEQLTDVIDRAISQEFATVWQEFVGEGEFTPGPDSEPDQGPVPEEEAGSVPKGTAEHVYIPKLEVTQTSGGKQSVTAERMETAYSFRRDWLNSFATSHRSACFIEMADESMAPTFHRGETMLIDTLRKAPVENKIFAIRDMDTVMIRRMRKTAKEVFLLSDNRTKDSSGDYLYPPKKLTKGMEIVGQVIWSAKKFL
jgi:hypothetical protein